MAYIAPAARAARSAVSRSAADASPTCSCHRAITVRASMVRNPPTPSRELVRRSIIPSRQISRFSPRTLNGTTAIPSAASEAVTSAGPNRTGPPENPTYIPAPPKSKANTTMPPRIERPHVRCGRRPRLRLARASRGAIAQSPGSSPARSPAVVLGIDWIQAVDRITTRPTISRMTATGMTQSGRARASPRSSAIWRTTQEAPRYTARTWTMRARFRRCQREGSVICDGAGGRLSPNLWPGDPDVHRLGPGASTTGGPQRDGGGAGRSP